MKFNKGSLSITLTSGVNYAEVQPSDIMNFPNIKENAFGSYPSNYLKTQIAEGGEKFIVLYSHMIDVYDEKKVNELLHEAENSDSKEDDWHYSSQARNIKDRMKAEIYLCVSVNLDKVIIFTLGGKSFDDNHANFGDFNHLPKNKKLSFYDFKYSRVSVEMSIGFSFCDE